MSQNTKRKTLRGYTLIELVVVIAIIAIISGIVLMNLSSQANDRYVEAEAREFTGVVREVQSYALTGKKFENQNDPCFYQVAWGGGSYSFTYYYKTGSDCSSPASAVIGVYSLENGVVISNSDSFYFTPPHAVPSFAAPGSLRAVFQKGSVVKSSCVYSDGLVKEVTGSTC